MEKINLTQSGRGYLLRISASDACNFYCAFCRPQNQHLSDTLSNKELIRIINSINDRYQLKTIHFTGGEPLLRNDLASVIYECRKMTNEEIDIAMTTNGALLADNLEDLAKAGLSRINISLHTLNSEKFKKITGSSFDVRMLQKTIVDARNLGISVKTNSVVIKNFNDDDIEDIMSFCFKNNIMPRFLELGLYGPVAQWFSQEDCMSRDEILENIEMYFGDFKRDYSYRGNGPTKYYTTEKGDVFGIVDHQTNKLCVGCDRFRLASNGLIRVCNFSPIDLKDGLESEEVLTQQMSLLGTLLNSRGDHYINKRVHKIDYNFRWNYPKKEEKLTK